MGGGSRSRELRGGGRRERENALGEGKGLRGPVLREGERRKGCSALSGWSKVMSGR